jgi:hypothetical protein
MQIVLEVYTDRIGLITNRIDADKKADAASKQLEVVVKHYQQKTEA